VQVNAFAKINLALAVLGTRPDGYHGIRTTFQSIALHDTLTFTATRGAFQIRCSDARCPTGADNLVWKAAARLWRETGRTGDPRGASVDIRKRIPLQSGLGGGSSDAAAALRALAILWRLSLSSEDLHRFAAGVGADVPYFLQGGTMTGEERGDALTPARDRKPSWVVVAVPAFGVSTKDAYSWFDESGGPSARPTTGGNDLQRPVVQRHPEIGRLVSALKRRGAAHAAMSGSGSAVFGLFGARRTADDAARALHPGVRHAFVTRTLTRREYARLARVRGAPRRPPRP
jgi:4-diphosphocytidyl-2-C-methyl-D-erythritol kinase